MLNFALSDRRVESSGFIIALLSYQVSSPRWRVAKFYCSGPEQLGYITATLNLFILLPK